MPQYIMPGKASPAFAELDEFTQGYIEAALWLYAEDEPPENPGFSDLSHEAVEKMKADCARFQKEAGELLAAAYLSEGYSEERAGVDFWLTRNGHGAGFWDRGLGKVGDDLTALCGWKTKFTETNMYEGDDGKIHYWAS